MARVLALALALSALAGARGASAQVFRVVIEDVRGPRAGAIEAHLRRSLEASGAVEVVDRAEVRRVARELGIRRSRLRPTDLPQVAEVLDVRAFLSGRVHRARRRWTFTVRVRDGASGEELGAASWTGRTVAALSAVRASGYERLEEHLLAASAPPVTPAPQQPAEGERPWWARGDAQAAEPPEGEGATDDGSDGARVPWLVMSAGGGVVHRTMRATAVVSVPRNDPTSGVTASEPRDYDSGGLGHLELGASAELFPGAIAGSQPFPWLGLAISFRHSAALTSYGCEAGGRDALGRCPIASEVAIPTTQSELYVGAKGRVYLGDGPGSLSLDLDLGWGRFAFELDPAALRLIEPESVIPPIAYTFLHLGGGLRVPLAPGLLDVQARGGLRLGFGVGDDARDIWGSQTTDVSGFVLGLEVRHLAAWAADGLFFSLGVDWAPFAVSYRGQTSCVDAGPDGVCYPDAPPDPGEAWEPWPHGADIEQVTGGIPDPVSDAYVRVALAIGWALR